MDNKPSRESGPDSRYRCVIADDIRTTRELLRSWVSDCGYDCEAVSNGAEAWSLIKQRKPHLVVTDIEMPNGNGLELLSSLRSNPATELRSVPVIVISSLADGAVEELVHAVGGNSFLSKPLEKQTIQAVVRTIKEKELRVDGPENQSPDTEQTDLRSIFRRVSPTLRRFCRDLTAGEPPFK